jgi:glycosyltransferase involved in cell wall biosynthesis
VVAQLSLSVVIPVHNAEKSLASKIGQLLDYLPDLTTNFEILIINDGSNDHTEEIAYDLAREFPQVRVAHHEMRRGERGVIETGLAQTIGDILFVQDENAALDSGKLHRLWELRNEEQLFLQQSPIEVQRPTLQRLAAWGVRLEEAGADGNSTGVQMIRRRPLSVRPAAIAGSALEKAPGRMSRADQPESQQRHSRLVRPTVKRKGPV